MKNIIFDLGGVVFARDPKKCTEDFIEFFSFIADKKMPHFWEEYDRGTVTIEQTIDHLTQIKGCSREKSERYVWESINIQEEIAPTANLIAELKSQGFKLYVLSNMSKEYIEYLRKMPVYKHFDGEVVSCEEFTVNPEEKIYNILLERYSLKPEESLFVDDRPANIEAASKLGINTVLFVKSRAEECCDLIREESKR